MSEVCNIFLPVLQAFVARVKKDVLIDIRLDLRGQMVWGTMDGFGTAGLYFLPPKIPSSRSQYLNLLREKL